MYQKVSVCDSIPAHKLKRCVTGGSLSLSRHELHGTGAHIYVHREVAEKIKKALKANKGVRLYHNHNEIYHGLQQGGSIFTKIGDFFKNKAIPWIKQNWNIIKPVVSSLADSAVPALATAFGAPEVGPLARQGLRTLTGVGVKGRKLVKGSPEAKARMAKIRGMKKAGGSFRL